MANDPGITASEIQRLLEGERAAASATSRTFGYNSNGDPEMYPSDMEMLSTKYALTGPESQTLWERSVVGDEDESAVVDEIRGSRAIFQQVFAAVPAEASVHGALRPAEPPAAHEPTAAVLETS